MLKFYILIEISFYNDIYFIVAKKKVVDYMCERNK